MVIFPYLFPLSSHAIPSTHPALDAIDRGDRFGDFCIHSANDDGPWLPALDCEVHRVGLDRRRRLMGTRYYEFRIDDLPQRTWLVGVVMANMETTVAHYPDGKLALSGHCRIVRKRAQSIAVDDLTEAVSFSPTGRLSLLSKWER